MIDTAAEAGRALELCLAGKSDESIAMTLNGERPTSAPPVTIYDVREMRQAEFRRRRQGMERR